MWRYGLLLPLVGCRLGFDEPSALRVVDNSSTPRGDLVIAAAPDATGFALAWNTFQLGQSLPSWTFAVIDNDGAWTVAPRVLFADRPEPCDAVQLYPLGSDRWLMLRQYDYLGVKMPVDLAIIDSGGALLASFEDSRTWFASAMVVPHATGFHMFFHHHADVGAGNYRQVFMRSYDLDGTVVGGTERSVDSATDTQFFVTATPLGGAAAVAWREDVGGAKFATVDSQGLATPVTVAQVTDIYWDPKVLSAAGKPLFVESSTDGLQVHRMEASGAASWTPAAHDLALGINRFESRSWAAASDDAAIYVAWESDVSTDLPTIAAARLDATGSAPALIPLDAIATPDDGALRLSPRIAVSATHYAVAFTREGEGTRAIDVVVRPR